MTRNWGYPQLGPNFLHIPGTETQNSLKDDNENAYYFDFTSQIEVCEMKKLIDKLDRKLEEFPHSWISDLSITKCQRI